MSSTIVHFSSQTMMKERKMITKVKVEESLAYPELRQDAPHKFPGGLPRWYKKVLPIP